MASKVRVLSVVKAFHILDLFQHHIELSLAEISHLMGMPKTTIYGIIATMESCGYLEQDPLSGKYRPGLGIFALSNVLRERIDIKDEAVKQMRLLSDKYEKNVHITIPMNNEVMYLESLVPFGKMMVKTVVGSVAPANCTSSGKAFLSTLSPQELDDLYANAPLAKLTPNSIDNLAVLKKELAKCHAQGYAVDNEESIMGVRGVGMTVINKSGKALLGISIAGSAHEMTPETVSTYVEELRKVAVLLGIKYGGIDSI